MVDERLRGGGSRNVPADDLRVGKIGLQPLHAIEHAHRVGDGESLAAIAGRYRVTPGSIVAVNRDRGASVRSGDLLVIPASVREQPLTVSAKSAVHRRTAPRRTPQRRVATAAAPQAQPTSRKPGAVAYSAANHSPAAKRRAVQR